MKKAQNKKPADIVLTVPSGEHCGKCMFLEDDDWHETSRCRLFDEPVDGRWQYGSLVREEVVKVDCCPRGDA